MRRWIALGATVGLVAALALTLAMPVRQVRSVYIPASHGHRVAVYGALAPFAPARFSAATVQRSPRIARDLVLGLLAGGSAAAALVAVGRRRPGREG